MPVGGKDRACREFLLYSNMGPESEFKPLGQLTPYALFDISNETKVNLIRAIQEVNKADLLLIILGESNVTNRGENTNDLVEKILGSSHNVFNEPIVKDYGGKITILIIDPTLNTSKGVEIDKSLVAKNVRSIVLIKEAFPLTPIFGPHKHYFSS